MDIFTRQCVRMVTTLLLISLTGCGQQEQGAAKVKMIRPAKIFTVADPASQAMRHFPGEVEANTDSNLAFRVSGQINEFLVKAGQEVVQGQLLASLDPKDFVLQLDDRQARYDLAKSQFERAKLLIERKLVPQSNFDEAKANLSVALSALNSAKTNLEYTHLRAPFSGTISTVKVEKHENIQAKQNILTLQTRNIIDISIQVPESIISRVNKNTKYQPTVIFDSHPEQSFLVTVKEWDTQADPSTLTYKVVFSLPIPTSFNVLSGMSASILIDLSKITTLYSRGVLVPVGAVFAAEDQPLASKQRFVWLFDPQLSTVSRKEVTVGEIHNDGIEVLTGLNTGEQIISAGVHFLSEGMQVQPWHREKGL